MIWKKDGKYFCFVNYLFVQNSMLIPNYIIENHGWAGGRFPKIYPHILKIKLHKIIVPADYRKFK